MELSYYPGCSLTGTSSEYDRSARAVCEELDIGLTEIDDWSCCGASSGHAMGGEALALALPARNLALAEKEGLGVMVPCAACYNRLKAAEVAARDGHLPEGAEAPEGQVDVFNIVEIVAGSSILPLLESKVTRPLTGLEPVPYYGCLLTRPRKITGRADAEDPRDMDAILKVLGAVPKRWSYKTACCGSGLTLSRPEIVRKLSGKILDRARRSHANCVVTACPMCLTNLEMTQYEGLRSGEMSGDEVLPVLFITEMIGLALEKSWTDEVLAKHLVDPRPYLRDKGIA